MKLEDLTKEELLTLIKRCMFQPSQRDITNVRWETMAAEASRIMDEALKESCKWTGVKGSEALMKWHNAQERFNEGLALSEKAEVVFKKLCETRG